MNEIRIFDISSSSRTGPLYITLLDTNDRNNNSCTNGNTALTIMSNKNSNDNKNKSRLLVGGSNGSLKLWEIPNTNILKSNQNHGNLLWSINPCNEKITNIIHLHSSNTSNDNNNYSDNKSNGLIMITTSYGSFVLFDIHKCSRKSFSSSKTPEQIKIWDISNRHRGLQNHILPSRDWLGVKKCFIQNIHTTLDVKAQTMKQLIDICVCLNSGWVMTMSLDLSFSNDCWQLMGHPIFKVYHKPTDVQFYDSEGNDVFKMKPPVCVPEIPTPAACLDNASSLVLIGNVEQIKITLPSSDKRVQGVGGQNVMSRENSCNKILIIDQKRSMVGIEDNDKASILSFAIPRGKLKNITVHPGNEWVILSYAKGSDSSQNSLQLMKLFNTRNHHLLK